MREAIPMRIVLELEDLAICRMTRKEMLIHIDDLKSALPRLSHEISPHLHEIAGEHRRLPARVTNAVDHEHDPVRLPSGIGDEIAQKRAYGALGPLDSQLTGSRRSVADKALGASGSG